MANYPESPQYRGVDWSWLADLPGEYYKGASNAYANAQQKRESDEAQAFQNGLPTVDGKPDGQVDWTKVAQIRAKFGDLQNAPQLAQLGQQQAQSQQIKNTDLLDIQPLAPQNAGQPAPPAMPAPPPPPPLGTPPLSNPPASAAAASPTSIPGAPSVSGRSAAPNTAQPAQGGTTVAQLVSSLPNLDGTLKAPENIARAITSKFGIDANTPLTPEQQQYADNVIANYKQSNGPMRMGNDGMLSTGLRAGAKAGPELQDQLLKAGQRLAQIESGGDYSAKGPVINGGDQALGKYQVMASNVPQWTKEATGRSMTPEQFLASPPAQEAVFRKIFGGYLQKTGNVADAASMWFTGKPLAAGGAQASDVNGMTGARYAQQVAGSTETGRSASMGQPQQGGPQGLPLVPQFPLPKGFTDPQQAIMALREKAAQYGSQYGSNPNADYNIRFWNGWADKIEASITPMKVGRYDSYVDPRTGKTVLDGAASGNSQVVQGIVDAIANGDQPPTLAGLYGQSAAVRAGLEKKGVNLANAQLQWQQAQKQVATLNGPQMTRFVGLASSVNSTIDEVRDLSEKMELSGIPLLNKAEIGAYIQTRGNTPNGQLAARYIAAVNTLKEEFANLAQGGYAPTESVWKLANNQINGDYGVKELGSSLDEVQRLIKYRVNAIPNLSTLGPGSANPYTGNPGQAPQSGDARSSSPSSPSQMPHVSSRADYDALPKGTRYIYPDGSVREK